MKVYIRKNLSEEIKQMLTPNLIPAPYNEWARMLGVSGLYEFAKRFGGKTLYVPHSDALMRHARDNLIRQDYNNGFNYKKLARKYGLTTSWIKRICENKEEK